MTDAVPTAVPAHPTRAVAAPATSPSSRAVRVAGMILLGAVAMIASSHIQVPFYPVPMTFQVGVVMVLGLAMGPRVAFASVLVWLAAGAAGLPVFAGTPARGIGLAYMVGPTGGYLLGQLIAASLVGWLAAGRGTVGRIGAMLAGLIAIYALGATWLAVILGSASRVIELGVAPFVLGDLAKIAVIALGGALLSHRKTRAAART